MTRPKHGFRSQTAVVAYCGEVERPEVPRIVDVIPPPDACPECVEVYNAMRQITHPQEVPA